MSEDWQDISTAPTDGRVVRLRFSGGGEAVAPWPPSGPLSLPERKTLIKQGEWPDYRTWTPTHWRPYADDKVERLQGALQVEVVAGLRDWQGAEAEIERLRTALKACITMIEDAMELKIDGFARGLDDVELLADGSYRLSDARAALGEPDAP